MRPRHPSVLLRRFLTWFVMFDAPVDMDDLARVNVRDAELEAIQDARTAC